MVGNDLKGKCKIATQEEGNSFVGIKAEVDEVVVYFPVGYQISENDNEIRKDILQLLSILKEFKDKQEGKIDLDNQKSADYVEFPLNSYLEVINYYMENGYYMERDPCYATKTKGKVNWSKTIKKQKPLLRKVNNSFSPIYLQYTVKEFTPNENNELLYINKHCVYESFKKLGWLFTTFVPQKPHGNLEKQRFLPILYKKLANTFNDSDKKLFQAMIDILEKVDNSNSNKQYFYGTEHFEHVWEGLVDNLFGISNKEEYYPRAQWNLPQSEVKSELKHALQPDTIMDCNGKIYVIDSKYYRYGYTKNPSHLPKSVDINKQISYAEFVQNNKGISDENIYNAFLMPFNKDDNLFDSDEIFLNIGEVIGDWRKNSYKYDHIQGILMDIKYLIQNYKGDKHSHILKLAKMIEDSYEKNKKLHESS